MLTNYLRIAYRNLLKNKAFSFINIFGLSVGMAAFLFILHYVRFERSYEDYNPNAGNLFRITLDFYKGNEYVVTDCETHAPIGPMVKEKMPEVVDFARMFHNDGLQEIKAGDQKFLEEGIYFADPSAIKMLAVEVVSGDPQKALNEPMQCVVSTSMAKKFFGNEQAIGKMLDVDGNVYAVTGVMRDVPSNTHLKFSILLSHASLKKMNEWYNETDGWSGNNEYTYLLVRPGTDLAAFNEKLTTLSASLKEKINSSRYHAEYAKDIHLYSNKTYEPEVNGSAKAVTFMLIIAIFIIVIAWVNYVNLSTARALERAKEVGIRKVMGSVRVQLVIQFLYEAIIVNVIAGAVAVFLIQTGMPLFRALTGQPLPFNVVGDITFWYIVAALLGTGIFLSGLYPSIVLSSFQPAAVLKGKFKSSSHGQRLRQALVIFQFGATVVLIVGMITVYLQVNYLRNYDLGMNIDQTLVIRTPRMDVSEEQFKSVFHSLKTELSTIPSVSRVTRSTSLPGLSLHELSSTSFTQVGKESNDGHYEYYFFGVDADFIPTMDMKLVAGRNFAADVPNHDQVIINEAAVERLGFANAEEAIGGKITFQTRWPGEPATIIGVMRNFYQRSPKEAHIPMLFHYSERASHFSVRIKADHVSETLDAAKAAWTKVFPDAGFNYFFLDDKFDQQFQSDDQFGTVIASFTILAVLIACLGLFGLSSYTILQRTKEIGIRKVLGASVGQIVNLLSRDFAKVVLIAGVLAIPVAWYAMDSWLSNYAIRIDLSVWIMLVPVVIILVLALVTVSFQTIRTALANPTNSLKQE